MERTERRRRTAAEMMRDAPRSAENASERHAALWDAINDVRGRVNYALGALAFIVPFVVGTFIAVVLK